MGHKLLLPTTDSPITSLIFIRILPYLYRSITIATAHITMPTQSLLHCVRDGKLDPERYLQFRSTCSQHWTRIRLRKRLFRRHADTGADADRYDMDAPKNCKIGPQTRRPRCVWGRVNEDGVKVPLKPTESMWYIVLHLRLLLEEAARAACNPFIASPFPHRVINASRRMMGRGRRRSETGDHGTNG